MAWPPLHCVPSSQETDTNRAGGDRSVPGEEALPGAKQKGLHDSRHLKAVAAFELEVGSKRGGESPGGPEAPRNPRASEQRASPSSGPWQASLRVSYHVIIWLKGGPLGGRPVPQ